MVSGTDINDSIGEGKGEGIICNGSCMAKLHTQPFSSFLSHLKAWVYYLYLCNSMVQFFSLLTSR